MVKDKIRQIGQAVKQSVKDTFKLLWQFKWYVLVDLIFFMMLFYEYLNPPAADDMIWRSEAMRGYWNYQNQELYVQSCKYGLIISGLFFLLGTSNMRNHPLLAKLIFLFPIFVGFIGIL